MVSSILSKQSMIFSNTKKSVDRTFVKELYLFYNVGLRALDNMDSFSIYDVHVSSD